MESVLNHQGDQIGCSGNAVDLSSSYLGWVASCSELSSSDLGWVANYSEFNFFSVFSLQVNAQKVY
jgi:hypothetical protein